MTRRPDLPCAGGCGKLLWRGGTDRGPRNQVTRLCRPCRAKPEHQAVLHLKRRERERARDRRRPLRSHPCPDCRASVSSYQGRTRCTDCRARRRRAYYRRRNVIRRGAAVAGPTLTIEQLGRRDGWRCHLCARRVDQRLRSPHPWSPTFDHLIPVADGGTDEPVNLRLAHRRCNSSRGRRGTVQLLLVG